mgnify:FL=1|jgi:hypothetical protein
MEINGIEFVQIYTPLIIILVIIWGLKKIKDSL